MVVMAAAAVTVLIVVMMMLVFLIMVVMMLVLLLIVMVAVLVLFLIVMAAVLVFLIMVVMMLVLFLVVMAAVFVLFLIVVVMMLVLLRKLLKKLCLQIDRMLENFKQLLTGQICERRRDNRRVLVDLANQLNGLVNLLLVCDIRPGEHNGLCILHLVVEELTEVLDVELRLLHIDQRDRGIASDREFFLDIRDSAHHIRELADTGGLNDHAVRRILCEDFLQRAREIADERAADAAGVHLPHLNAGIF